MAGDSDAIRAGGAHVEVSAEDSSGLAEALDRLERNAAEHGRAIGEKLAEGISAGARRAVGGGGEIPRFGEATADVRRRDKAEGREGAAAAERLAEFNPPAMSVGADREKRKFGPVGAGDGAGDFQSNALSGSVPAAAADDKLGSAMPGRIAMDSLSQGAQSGEIEVGGLGRVRGDDAQSQLAMQQEANALLAQIVQNTRDTGGPYAT